MNADNEILGIVILAAGASVRLGKPKQSLRFREKTLLRRVAESAIATKNETIIVLGANADKIIPEITDLSVEVVFNKDWKDGMSSSVKIGLEKLLEIKPATEGVILLVCDQPFVNKKTIFNLIETRKATGKTIVACKYNNTIGVPALFMLEMFGKLSNLKGDSGAKNLMLENGKILAVIDAPEAAFDVDTIKDFEKLSEIRQSKYGS